MDHFPANWGNPRSRDDTLFASNDYFPGPVAGDLPVRLSKPTPTTHTQQPIVTGTSVLGIKYKDGIMLAADTLASYGSLAQFRDMRRIAGFGSSTIIGASGDMSDWQHIQEILNAELIEEASNDDGHKLHPKHIYEYVSNIMYHHRSKVNPLWNSLVIGGFQDGKHFLGFVDLLGTTYQSSTIATGYGAYIAQPLLRKAVEGREDELTEAEATVIMEDALRVLFYRDARSLNRVQIATVSAAGISISEPYSLTTEWSFADNIRGYGAMDE